MAADFETVYTVTDFWDGIRAGIADFNGVPHYYERLDEQRDEQKDDWVDLFLLKRIDQETFRLAMEDWEIWKRWYISGCQPKTHPALPEDRARHTEITEILSERLVVTPSLDVKAQAEFERDYRDIHPKHASNPMAKIKVKWQVIS
jgi:hypothetical protein